MAVSIRILDTAVLSRRQVLVLELDAPAPLVGVYVGMPVTLVSRDGRRGRATLKGLGFASSTPDHAHVIVSAPTGGIDDLEPLTDLEFEATP